MANPHKGEVAEKVGGKTMTFRIAANEWCELEDEFGKTTDEIMGLFFSRLESEKLDFRLMRSLFRASMIKRNPEVTHDEAGELMAEMGLVESAGLLGRIIAASMPDAEEAATPPANPPKRGAGTGKPSSKTTSR